MSRTRYIQLKVQRACEHLKALKEELARYYDSEPCKVTTFRRPEIGRRGIRLEMKDPDDRVYLLTGDFAHNLRSALDHVVYALIVQASKELPDSNLVQWPVQIAEDAKLFERQTRGVPAEAATIILELQPYKAGPGEAYKGTELWQLHKLDIVDKHRRIAINQRSVLSYFPTLSKKSDVKTEHVCGGYEVHFPIDYPVVPMEYNPKPKILFGAEEEGLRVTVQRMEEIDSFVANRVISRFERFFDDDLLR